MFSRNGARGEGYVQELFHEEAQQVSQTQTKPWWKIQLFVWEPVLFGTWDGVFTSCMINIFGVVLFLRTGWLVGNTGIVMGMFLVSFVILVALVTVLSGIGVCEKCSIGSGGVYSMISTVLGGQVGGTIGLLYIFGQCVAGAMYITGFAESIAGVLSLSNIWAVRGISLAVLLGLLGINLAGVKWIIRLQLLLLFLLAVSTLDFVIGSFTHLDPEHGFVGYSEELMFNNTLPDYSQGESFFTVFGVFFPAATGVMAGFNMSGDLQKPSTNIPVGSLAAIGTSWFLYMVFVFLLGAICTRQSLRYDFMIAEKVSLVGFLFLLGLYISSLASCMGGLYGAPRILQCIAQENVIPMLAFLGRGKGPNKTPVAAICLTSLITMAFVFIGQVNVLAPIVTINFMLTYISVDYSYFSLSLSYNIQQKTEETQKGTARPAHSSQPLIFNKSPSRSADGVIQSRSNGTLLEFKKDMDQLFKPFFSEPSTCKREGAENLTQKVKQKKAKKPAKQTLQDSFLLDLQHDAPLAQYSWDETTEPHERQQDVDEQGGQWDAVGPAVDAQHVPRTLEQREQLCSEVLMLPGPRGEESSVKQQNPELEIQHIPESLYSRFFSHWISFAGAIVSLIIMFVIQWIYTLVSLGAAVILYFYIGQVSPGLPLGAAANFSFFGWIKSVLITSCRRRPSPQEQIVVTPSFATVGMETRQLTEENADFAWRDRYHQSSLISREEFGSQFQ
ncbi:PREDICTED: solute carrier family 12 member 8 isoform X1 [Sturnus vulgaris]|uniref:solute carrier family 12 member 8 isoform X1 n=1 Tax=Sturnus vulgaris TaxID=9172 RepID=UPI00071A7638|nr:PREDICTED: solute carrier family 12 member 8 isoform X1 [Sturnus vulgaris]XP_014727278.1 PREDICTED: solute carrier family 12 member 8 isoform X1 [Sturnus vulgaris]XP_014727279.1 PREDICTED: solute carrier family 12 member 8 isoform X1 [Sturnus vulgaris]